MIDYYGVLNIPFASDSESVRKAYYRLAKVWHPDKNKDSEAATRFMEISDAYKVLSDETSKTFYDFQRIVEDESSGYSSSGKDSGKEENDENNTFEYFMNLFNCGGKNKAEKAEQVGKKRRRKRDKKTV
jgi:DnaJ-class molecular chaperone